MKCFCSNYVNHILVMIEILELSTKTYSYGDGYLKIMEVAATKDFKIGETIRGAMNFLKSKVPAEGLLNECRAIRQAKAEAKAKLKAETEGGVKPTP